ncbi:MULTISPECIES: hypothetical protein [Dyella]|uniref:S9 family peptidase n=2 Tax=Dyella TaxID=231454 RepID=A0A4V2NLE1_9GAMM|nr:MULTISPECIES: hypothetical protein [Dyella]TBR36725.1 hypothetical protein EYV96_12465 [Dyella terrae]TCI08184.1 hypothetical protein EZM97_26405 [Dyella soli]
MNLFAALVMLAASGVPPCGSARLHHGDIQWSERITVSAPDRASQVEVHPNLESDENETPVILRFCRDGSTKPLITLQRAGTVNWSPDSQRLLIINSPVSNTYEVMLFTLSGDGQVAEEGDLNADILRERPSAGPGFEKVIFYLPNFASWKGNELVLSVGVTLGPERSGPTSTMCYGVAIDSQTHRVSRSMSAATLKKKYGASCQMSP